MRIQSGFQAGFQAVAPRLVRFGNAEESYGYGKKVEEIFFQDALKTLVPALTAEQGLIIERKTMKPGYVPFRAGLLSDGQFYLVSVHMPWNRDRAQAFKVFLGNPDKPEELTEKAVRNYEGFRDGGSVEIEFQDGATFYFPVEGLKKMWDDYGPEVPRFNSDDVKTNVNLFPLKNDLVRQFYPKLSW